MTPFQARRAVRVLRAGGVIAYPTEAVYGLGCDPLDHAAVMRLLELKRRPWHKGLILVAADFRQLEPFVGAIDGQSRARVDAAWPGPATFILPAAAATPHWLTGVHAGLAVRVSAHPLVAELCRLWGGPLVSTSANPAGLPPARSALGVRRYFAGELDLILAGATSGLARPTPIRDAASGELLRI